MADYRMMIVDDERDVLMLVAEALRRDSIFEVDAFDNPAKALAHFENHAKDYSLVLSDIRMGEMSGLDFLKSVLRIRPEIPFLIMTAFAFYEDEISNALPQITKQDILYKPFGIAEVQDAVKKKLNVTS